MVSREVGREGGREFGGVFGGYWIRDGKIRVVVYYFSGFFFWELLWVRLGNGFGGGGCGFGFVFRRFK